MKPRVPLAVLSLILGSSAIATEAPPGPDPCTLLTDDEIQRVQEQPVVKRVGTVRQSPSFRVLQCFYQTADFANSVSLALSIAEGGPGAVRYWNERFHGESVNESGPEGPPLPVAGLGEEAYWVGDAKTGAVYALTGDRFLRISIGGVADEATRKARSLALADAAVPRVSLATARGRDRP